MLLLEPCVVKISVSGNGNWQQTKRSRLAQNKAKQPKKLFFKQKKSESKFPYKIKKFRFQTISHQISLPQIENHINLSLFSLTIYAYMYTYTVVTLRFIVLGYSCAFYMYAVQGGTVYRFLLTLFPSPPQSSNYRR